MSEQTLPEGWIEVELGLFNQAATKNMDPASFPDETFELYSVPSFPTGRPEILLGKDIGSTKQTVEPDDVLICKINPRINRVWVVKEKTQYRQIASSEWIVVRNSHIDPIFLRNLFSSKKFRDELCADVTGVGGSLTRAQPKRVAQISVPIAPLNEQKRIADKLDQLLAAVDSCKARLDTFPNIIKRFRQSVLAAATSGELTADWREEHNGCANDIFNRLSDDRQRKWSGRGKYKTALLAEETESTEFMSLPDTWFRGTLDQITWSVKDGPHFSPTYAESGIPFISGGSIKPGAIDLSIAKYITNELHQEFSLRCKPDYLDILYTKGGTTGLAAVNTLHEDFNVWVHVAVLKLISSDLIDPFFVQHALNSPDCYQQSQRYTHGVGNQDLGLTRMIKIVLPIPPIEEQKEIVRRVDALIAVADRLEARYKEAVSQIDQLTPSLLAKAFRGELVPQDPDDEPAEKLLELIQSTQLKNGATTAKRRSKPSISKRETA